MIEFILQKLGRVFGRNLFKYDRGYIFELDRAAYEKNRTEGKYPESYRARTALPEELPEVSRVADLPETESKRRADAGNICFGVFEENRPANINWVHSGSCYVRGAGYIHRAEKKDYYIYGIVTDPAERGKGLYKNALYDLAGFLFGKDARKLIQLVQDGNAPVLHTLPKLGYQITKEYTHYRFFGIKLTVERDHESGEKKKLWFLSPPPEMFVI